MIDFQHARERMVESQLVARGILDRRVLDAMRRVPREAFVAPDLRKFAYDDTPLPIGENQTISQPYIVARMIEAAEVTALDRVLEVGTGSGYAAAVLARLAARVDSIERRVALADGARAMLAALGIANVEVHHGDGTLGFSARAPFDAIIAAAGGPAVPSAWLAQLAARGRLVMPVGERRHYQRLVKMVRLMPPQTGYRTETLGDVLFVPLIGEDGWRAGPGDP